MSTDSHEVSSTGQYKESARPNVDPTVDFAAGTLAGIIGLVVGFPLDTVKVRYQNPETALKYSGVFATITKIVKEERFRGLYKGIMSPMAGCAFLNGLVFSSYGLLMRLQLQSAPGEPSIAQIGLAGAGSGIVSSLITCPMELIKIRQQAITTSQPSSKEVALEIFKARGIQGLFRGIGVTALRDCGYGAYFASYEAACRTLRYLPVSLQSHSSLASETNSELVNISWPRLMLAGGFAGVMGWFATFGLDVVKTRVQATDRVPGNPYRSTISAIVNSYGAEGPRVFFIGLFPTLIRAVPVNMAIFGAYELVVKIMS